MFGLKGELRAPEDGGDSLSGSTGLSEDLALLSEGEDETPKPEGEGDEEGQHFEEGEGQELTDEQKAAQEEEEEELAKPHELAPHDRPTYTDLKTYDPELFKEFPGLKDVMFREKAYTELFTNIDDAKQAVENAAAFERSRESIFSGDVADFVGAIKETDPKALGRFAARILPALYKVDQDAHWTAANPILESMVKGFLNSAKDDKTKEAAKLFAEFMFGDIAQDILDGKRTYVPQVEESKKDPEREQFLKERHDAFTGDIIGSSLSGLANLIASKDKSGKDRIDPDEAFSPWMRRTVIEKISQEIRNQMQADKDHTKYMDDLWKKAKRDGYKAEWKTRITNAFLARARQLVPAVRSQIISEVYGKQARRSDKIRKVVDRTSRPEGGTGGRSSNGTGKFDANRKIDYSKTSDEDLISDNITYKG